VLALESALNMAEGEHRVAVDALTTVQHKVARAEHALQQACEDCARLVFEMALRDFAAAARTALTALPDSSIQYILDDVHSAIYAEA